MAIVEAAIAGIARRGVRGLRVEEVAADAGVATSLVYYYFGNRVGLVRAALDQANERAAAASADGGGEASAYEDLERMLEAEFDDRPEVRDGSVVWGEVLASAVFEPELRVQLRGASQAWVELVSARIREGLRDGSVRSDADAEASAQRLTALVDGLSARWLAGVIEAGEARALLRGALRAELRA